MHAGLGVKQIATVIALLLLALVAQQMGELVE